MPGETEALTAWLMSWLHGPYGMIVLSLTAFSEAFVLPVLPDLILMALCFMDPSNALLYAGLCSLSSAGGAVLGYGIGRFGGRPLLDRLVSEAKIGSVERVYQRYGIWPIAVAGFFPLPYKIFTITAGVFSLELKQFIVASVTARSLRFFLVAWLLQIHGDTVAHFVRSYFSMFAAVLTAVFVTGFVFFNYCLMRAGRSSSDHHPAGS
jgi:membrane protein YqaA with SNARE-associated domain